MESKGLPVRAVSGVAKSMTQDFIDDFIAACHKEGANYFLVVSTDAGNNAKVFHNYDELPEFRHYPDGTVGTQKEDFMQLVSVVPFTKET